MIRIGIMRISSKTKQSRAFLCTFFFFSFVGYISICIFVLVRVCFYVCISISQSVGLLECNLIVACLFSIVSTSAQSEKDFFRFYSKVISHKQVSRICFFSLLIFFSFWDNVAKNHTEKEKTTKHWSFDSIELHSCIIIIIIFLQYWVTRLNFVEQNICLCLVENDIN